MATVVQLAGSLSSLLQSMWGDVVRHTFLPLDEVREWRWSELQAAHTQVRRERYDQAIAEIQGQEHAAIRAYIATRSRKHLPGYKSFDDVAGDLWGERRHTAEVDDTMGALTALYTAKNLPPDDGDQEDE